MRTRTFMKSALAAAVALSTVMTLAAPSLAAARHHRSAPAYAYGRIDHPGILHPAPRQEPEKEHSLANWAISPTRMFGRGHSRRFGHVFSMSDWRVISEMAVR